MATSGHNKLWGLWPQGKFLQCPSGILATLITGIHDVLYNKLYAAYGQNKKIPGPYGYIFLEYCI